MVTAQELHDKYKEDLVDENLGEELIPQVYSQGLQGIMHDEVVKEDGHVDRGLIQHLIHSIKSPVDRNHHWMVFGATVNVKQVENEEDIENVDREAMREDHPEASEMFMIQVVTPSESINYLYDGVTGELYEKIEKDGDNVQGDLAP